MADHTPDFVKPEWEVFRAILAAVSPDDPTGHLPDCGYTNERKSCGCAEFGTRLIAALRSVIPQVIRNAKADALAEAASVPAWSLEQFPEHIAFGRWLTERERMVRDDTLPSQEVERLARISRDGESS